MSAEPINSRRQSQYCKKIDKSESYVRSAVQKMERKKLKSLNMADLEQFSISVAIVSSMSNSDNLW